MNKKLVLCFLRRDLEQVIEEAKKTALKNVQERLVRDLQDLFMAEAVRQLEGAGSGEIPEQEGPPDEPDDEPKPHPAIPVRDEAREMADEDCSPVVLEDSSEPERFIYLFGVTEKPAARLIAGRAWPGMTDDCYVGVIDYPDLLAVVCEVPGQEFNEARIQELSENRAWLEDKAERHQRVVAAVTEQFPIIPMRFCTLYRSREGLEAFLEENREGLKELLGYLTGKAEWGLKLYLAEDVFHQFIREEDPGIKKLLEELAQNNTGKGYFFKKKLENKIDEDLEEKGFACADRVHRELSGLSSSAVLNRLFGPETTGRREKMILNGAYLVEKEREKQFFAAVEKIEEQEGSRGFIFEISGPWPCYNFCRTHFN